MKQYKNKTTGAIFNKAINCNSYYSDKYQGYYIPSDLVEGSCDWEEVVAKDYEILNLHLNGKNFSLKEDGKYWSEEGTWCNYVGMLNDKIISVKRLSDNKTFKIGDKAKTIGKYPHTITSIEIRQKNINTREKDGVDRIWLNWGNACGGSWLENVELVREPILTTEDGVTLFGGESVYGLTDDFQLCFTSFSTKDNVQRCRIFAEKRNAEEYIKTYKNYKTADGNQILEGQTFYLYDDKWFKCLEGKHGQFKSDKWAGKRYKTREEVEEMILMNKPCLSLNEIKEFSRATVYEIVADNLKELVAKKIKNN